MGKRTKDKSDEEIKIKIRRLEDELRSRNNPQVVDRVFEYDFDASSYNYREELELDAYATGASVGGGPSDEEDASERRPLEDDVEQDTIAANADAEETDESAPQRERLLASGTQDDLNDSRIKSVVVEVTPNTSLAQANEDAVPTEILAVLGEAKKSNEALGKKIPCEVSERWGQILVEGLAKEQKESLLTKAQIPENFQLAKAPKLNAEVASVLTEPAKNRDKRLEKMQNQLGCGIAGLVNLTSELINNDLSKMDIIKKLSEASQVLLDLHYEETLNRRRLIIPMLDKSFINIIQGVKRDDYLFGNNLGDNIKTSKSIERSSLQIKKPFIPQPSTSRKPAGQQGNFRAPARQGSGSAAASRAPPVQYRYYQPPPPPPAARRPPPPPRRHPPPAPLSRPLDRRSRR